MVDRAVENGLRLYPYHWVKLSQDIQPGNAGQLVIEQQNIRGQGPDHLQRLFAGQGMDHLKTDIPLHLGQMNAIMGERPLNCPAHALFIVNDQYFEHFHLSGLLLRVVLGQGDGKHRSHRAAGGVGVGDHLDVAVVHFNDTIGDGQP